MLTINYNSIKDTGPEEGQRVIVLSKSKYFDSISIITTVVEVELHWVQYDEQGYATGMSLTFDRLSNYIIGDTIQDQSNPELSFQLEWINSKDYLYWIDSSQYLKTVLKDINYES